MTLPYKTRLLSRRHGLLAALGALLAGCSGVDVLDRLVPSTGYRLDEGVAYGSDPRQRLDVYRPAEGAVAGPPPPLVVFFYGGSWSRGDRRDYRFVGEALASAGAVAVVADYRVSPAVRYPVFVRDGAQAVRWAVDHAAEVGADPRRIYVMGHSAGGHIAAMVALDGRWLGEQGLSPQRLAGFIGLAGAYDFLPIGDPEVQMAFDWPATPRDSQPLVHASAQAPRTLLLAAERDAVVDPVRNSAALAARLREQGADVAYRAYPRANHVTLMGAMAGPLRWIAPVRDAVVDFIGLPATHR